MKSNDKSFWRNQFRIHCNANTWLTRGRQWRGRTRQAAPMVGVVLSFAEKWQQPAMIHMVYWKQSMVGLHLKNQDEIQKPAMIYLISTNEGWLFVLAPNLKTKDSFFFWVEDRKTVVQTELYEYLRVLTAQLFSDGLWACEQPILLLSETPYNFSL